MIGIGVANYATHHRFNALADFSGPGDFPASAVCQPTRHLGRLFGSAGRTN